MLYLQFWTSFWKEYAETAADGETVTAELPSLPDHTDDQDALTPQEKYDYFTQYGTQILGFLHPEKGCTYLSRNLTTITGHACEALAGEHFYSIIHADYRQRLRDILADKDAKSQPFRCKMLHADRKYYWYLFNMHPKQDEYVCMIENIHQTMQTQNTLQKARLEAELALRARSEFLANMSHELRTPLNAVIGFSQIIEKEIFGAIQPPQYLDYAKHIQESGHDLLARIEDLLEIANIDAGRVVLSREEVTLRDLVKNVLEAQAHHAQLAKVTVEFIAPENEVLLYADRLKLQHILGHLVANAIRHSHAEGRVTVKARRMAHGLELSVHDTGEGMAETKLGAIVSALQEDNCWSAHDNRSIGLGLALTREFVALHGGQVEVHSAPGKGTTIQISLPKDCMRARSLQKADYLQAVS